MNNDGAPFFFHTETTDKIRQISTGGQKTIRIFRKLEKNIEAFESMSIAIVERQQQLDRIFDQYSETLMVNDDARAKVHTSYYLSLLPFTKGKHKGLSAANQAIFIQQVQNFLQVQSIRPENNYPALKTLFKEVMALDYEIWQCEMMGSITGLMQAYLEPCGIALYTKEDELPVSDAQLFDDIINDLTIHYNRLLDADLHLQVKTVKLSGKSSLDYDLMTICNNELEENRQIFVYDSMMHHLTQMQIIAQRSSHTYLRDHFSREVYKIKLLKNDYKNTQKIYTYFKDLLRHDFESHPAISKRLFEQLESAYLSQSLKQTLPKIISEWLDFTMSRPEGTPELLKLDYINKIIKWHTRILKNQLSRLSVDEIYEFIVMGTDDFEICDEEMLEDDLMEDKLFIEQYTGLIEAIARDPSEGVRQIMEICARKKRLDADFKKMEHHYWRGNINLSD